MLLCLPGRAANACPLRKTTFPTPVVSISSCKLCGRILHLPINLMTSNMRRQLIPIIGHAPGRKPECFPRAMITGHAGLQIVADRTNPGAFLTFSFHLGNAASLRSTGRTRLEILRQNLHMLFAAFHDAVLLVVSRRAMDSTRHPLAF